MNKRQSLSARVIVYLALAQFAALFFLIPITDFFVSISGVSPNWEIAPDDWGEYRIHSLVVDSLMQAPEGTVVLEPTAALRAYNDANPQVRYAAFDQRSGQALRGSSPELVAALGGFNQIEASAIKFRIPGNETSQARGYLRQAQTAFGPYAIAAYGYRFAWSDLVAVAGLFLTLHTAIVTAPAMLGALAIAWFVVQRGLAPLRAAAADIAAIDMNTLHQRVAANDAPKEVVPFIDAVNAALARLDAGVAAQRRFTANAAHELRTPIAIMRAHADNPDDVAFRRNIRRDIRRIQTIVEQLLATARFSVRKECEQDRIDLGTTVLHLVADYAPLMIENKKRIAFEEPESPTEVRCARWALECVVANLLDNALRAEPEGDVVRVRVLSGAAIEVIDHGPGVAPSDREKIFEPFWRRDREGVGVGLGLSISKRLVERMGGSILVKDTPGGGATFRIELEEFGSGGCRADRRRRSIAH
ncbi:HAMP domain-containing histidine kinase [Methylocystis sp. H62]|uniref:sensor histidine kinase n=1 Tax=Methylocystis sp. H62 TaxID=2785789 RepID=UPI0018C2D6FB|nr:HAMP domain-containing sensor histidine kinase [Methylocystis sp. H62]MBG0795847.1 HAMP domain-containing histidine kinase [Methylocystis sp. H62]